MLKNTLFLMTLVTSTIIAPLAISKETILFNGISKEATLFNAVASKNMKEVKRCVAMGTDLNTVNSDGKTVLDIAVEKNYSKMSRYLLKNGASVTSVANARFLDYKLKRRGSLMIGCGLLLCGGLVGIGLFFGGLSALNNSSMITVL